MSLLFPDLDAEPQQNQGGGQFLAPPTVDYNEGDSCELLNLSDLPDGDTIFDTGSLGLVTEKPALAQAPIAPSTAPTSTMATRDTSYSTGSVGTSISGGASGQSDILSRVRAISSRITRKQPVHHPTTTTTTTTRSTNANTSNTTTTSSNVPNKVGNTDSGEFAWMKSGGEDDLLLLQPIESTILPIEPELDIVPAVESVAPIKQASEPSVSIPPPTHSAPVAATVPVPTTTLQGNASNVSKTPAKTPMKAIHSLPISTDRHGGGSNVANHPHTEANHVPSSASNPTNTPAKSMATTTVPEIDSKTLEDHPVVVDPEETEVILRRPVTRRQSRIPMSPGSSLRRKYSREPMTPGAQQRCEFAEAATPARPRRSSMIPGSSNSTAGIGTQGTPSKGDVGNNRRLSSVHNSASKFGLGSARKSRVSALHLVPGSSAGRGQLKRTFTSDYKENDEPSPKAAMLEEEGSSSSKLRRPKTPSRSSRHRSVLFSR